MMDEKDAAIQNLKNEVQAKTDENALLDVDEIELHIPENYASLVGSGPHLHRDRYHGAPGSILRRRMYGSRDACSDGLPPENDEEGGDEP